MKTTNLLAVLSTLTISTSAFCGTLVTKVTSQYSSGGYVISGSSLVEKNEVCKYENIILKEEGSKNITCEDGSTALLSLNTDSGWSKKDIILIVSIKPYGVSKNVIETQVIKRGTTVTYVNKQGI